MLWLAHYPESGAGHGWLAVLEKQGNLREAEKFYRLAADKGNANAQCNLGLILKEQGKAEEARKFFHLAASQGHYYAKLMLKSKIRRFFFGNLF